MPDDWLAKVGLRALSNLLLFLIDERGVDAWSFLRRHHYAGYAL